MAISSASTKATPKILARQVAKGITDVWMIFATKQIPFGIWSGFLLDSKVAAYGFGAAGSFDCQISDLELYWRIAMPLELFLEGRHNYLSIHGIKFQPTVHQEFLYD